MQTDDDIQTATELCKLVNQAIRLGTASNKQRMADAVDKSVERFWKRIKGRKPTDAERETLMRFW